jgi:CBS domain-containing protein
MSKAPDHVDGVMTPDVVAVGPEDAVAVALRAMIDRDIGSVVVAEDRRPVGMFTERDITRGVLDDPKLLARPIRDVMSAPVVTVEPDEEVVRAFELMNAKRVRRLPVVRDGVLMGIVTERDLLRWVDRVARE